ncbi:MAG: 50S ribosomal protein L6, partial [Gemmatimonadales bacterium]
MSRIGRRPISVPKDVTVTIKGSTVSVKGPKGELSRALPRDITASLEDGVLTVARPTEQEHHKALHGLSRTLVANMVDGVSKGFERVLEIQGVGYKAEVIATGLKLSLGFSHQVVYAAPASIKMVEA